MKQGKRGRKRKGTAILYKRPENVILSEGLSPAGPWGEERAWQPAPVFLPGESPGSEESGGQQSMGLQRVGHD